MRWLVFLLFIPVVGAATLSGTLYGPDLSVVEQAIMTIEGDVEQVIVLSNGSYEIDLEEGSYLITVESGDLLDRQRINLPAQGMFIRDFIMLPSLDLPDLPDVPEFESDERSAPPIGTGLWWFIGAALGAIAIIATIVGMRTRSRRSVFDEYEKAVIEALIKHEGRATQKQIRSELAFSEAKVSLVVSDLASRGVVRKFKQGRGNVVVLQDGSSEKNEES